MVDFNWEIRDDSAEAVDPDSAFALLGLMPGPVTAPVSNVPPPPPVSPAARVEAPAARVEAPAPAPAAAAVAPALSRRELREREQAEAAALSAAQPVAQPVSQPAAQPSLAQSAFALDLPAEPPAQPSSRRGPRAPKPVRPVRHPRGMTRPRAAAPRSTPRPAALRKPKSLKRRMLSKLMTFGAMVGAGLMMVSTSIPANAFLPNDVTMGGAITEVPALASAEAQSLKVHTSSDQIVMRDGYTATSLREQIFLKYGNRNFSFTNDPNGTIQWPFPIGVPISSGFGDRIAPCRGCSSFHEGVDFTPGGGTPIQAIADGVVSLVREDAYGLGCHVIIDHHINGQLVQSVYGHMERGSIKVVEGQQVKVTDIVGLVGSTGASTGDHLHLEIHVNGVQVDPFAWLKANAN